MQAAGTIPRCRRAAAAGRAAQRQQFAGMRQRHAYKALPPLRSQAEHKELLGALEGLSDEELAGWAAEHRERLSLPFLSWLSDEELAASAEGSGRRQELWELGSKLMALREGLSPVGAEVLQAELRAAALRCSAGSSGSSSSKSEEAEARPHGEQQAQQGAAPPPPAQQQQQQQQPGGAALAAPAFRSAVQRTAAMGLSPEGMALFQQQAAALEAVVGVSRARSLTEVIGRAKVADARQVQRLAEADSATRILDVLLSVPDRSERAAMLPDAFTPPAAGAAAADDDAAFFPPGSWEEEQVFTTPLRLLQAIDLYERRLSGSSGSGARVDPRKAAAELAGGRLGLTLPQLLAALRELREDVEGYWASGSEGEGEGGAW